ncbi:hypothetical protein [Pyrobaculum ferrireducens]|uniref:hypothetical protein n=1 Tax=Pyrobaculum ferrireducens TaxID=1104324 RepID=UPI000A80499C|nr:hypothetical protein [Pyrobaculum ferrireducens]
MKGARSAGRSGVVGSLGKGGRPIYGAVPERRTDYHIPTLAAGCMSAERRFTSRRGGGEECWEHYSYYDQP